MTFTHIPTELDISHITDKTSPNGVRIYQHLETGEKWPSITTILQDYKKDVLDAWVKRIGQDKANEIKNSALLRGNTIHEMSERYLKNEPIEFLLSYGKEYQNLFNAIRQKLNRYVNNIRVQEKPLYSRKLKIAGRCDLIADWDGKLSVIDFKGSGGVKKAEWIDNYYIQVTFYALAYYEMTGQVINQAVIVIANDGSKSKEKNYGPKDLGNTVNVYKISIKEYMMPLLNEIKSYYKTHTID
jgi:ATP-dependent exoDNAse (exonuclease V) beta subunit